MWKNLRQHLIGYYNQYDASHDMAHIDRVYENAVKLSQAYPDADQKIIVFAVGLHDVEDKKYENADSAQFMSSIFTLFSISESEQQRIRQVIEQVSFSGGQQASTLEAQIVQDADRLDALGAIGIARTFAFGGSRGRSLYNHQEAEQVLNGEAVENGSSITHFYEKLLHLKKLMNTEAAKQMAEERHEFMLQFLTQLYKEIGDQPCHN